MTTYLIFFTCVMSLLVSACASNFGMAAFILSASLFFLIFYSLFYKNDPIILFGEKFEDGEIICLKSIPVFFIILIHEITCLYFSRKELLIISSCFLALILTIVLSRGYRYKLVINLSSENVEESLTLYTLKKLFSAYKKQSGRAD